MTIKTIIAAIATATTLTVFCAPPPGGRGCPSPYHPAPHPIVVHHEPHHVHHNDHIVGASIIGGAILGSAIINACIEPKTVVVQQPIVQTPVVVEKPVVVQQTPVVTVQKVQVWVPGRFIDQIQANGTIVRTWQEGHYEWQ